MKRQMTETEGRRQNESEVLLMLCCVPLGAWGLVKQRLEIYRFRLGGIRCAVKLFF